MVHWCHRIWLLREWIVVSSILYCHGSHLALAVNRSLELSRLDEIWVVRVDIRQFRSNAVLQEFPSWSGQIVDHLAGSVNKFSAQLLVFLHLFVWNSSGHLDQFVLNEL